MMRNRILVLLMIASLVLVACGGGSETRAPANDSQQESSSEQQSQQSQGEEPEPQKTVKLGVIPGAQDFVTYVMEQQKFTEKHNLKLDILKMANPPAAQTALVNKQVDVSFCGFVNTVKARAEGKDMVIFGMLTGPSNLVLAKKDSPINSIKDLKGKKLGSFGGTSSTTYQMLAMISERVHGVTLGEDVEVVTAPNPALKGLLDKGDLDAVLFGTTDSIKVYLSGEYKIVADLAGEFESEIGGVPAHVCIGSNDEYVNANPDVIKSFYAAYLDTINYIKNNPQVWERYAKEIELDHPEGPKMLAERMAPRYVTKWDEKQVKIQEDFINGLIEMFGAEKIMPEIPEGWYRLDLQKKTSG